MAITCFLTSHFNLQHLQLSDLLRALKYKYWGLPVQNLCHTPSLLMRIESTML